MIRLNIRPEKCINCLNCELACSMVHANDSNKNINDKNVPLYKKVIEVEKSLGINVPLTCLQCANPACMSACSFDAITLNEERGVIEINQDKCVSCKSCLYACPFGAIRDYNNVMLKCDLCSGNPACANFCPEGAITYE